MAKGDATHAHTHSHPDVRLCSRCHHPIVGWALPDPSPRFPAPSSSRSASAFTSVSDGSLSHPSCLTCHGCGQPFSETDADPSGRDASTPLLVLLTLSSGDPSTTTATMMSTASTAEVPSQHKHLYHARCVPKPAPCDHCRRPFGDGERFLQASDGRRLHADCLEAISPTCVVCAKSLTGRHCTGSLWGEKFCAHHVELHTHLVVPPAVPCAWCERVSPHSPCSWCRQLPSLVRQPRPSKPASCPSSVSSTNLAALVRHVLAYFKRATGVHELIPGSSKIPPVRLVPMATLRDAQRRYQVGTIPGGANKVMVKHHQDPSLSSPAFSSDSSSSVSSSSSSSSSLAAPLHCWGCTVCQYKTKTTTTTSVTSPASTQTMVRHSVAITEILLREDLPRVTLGAVLAHELGHVYLRMRERKRNLADAATEEGVCEVVSRGWLETFVGETPDEERFREYLIRAKDRNTDATYGEGYRQGRQRLLEMEEEENDTPTTSPVMGRLLEVVARVGKWR